MQKFKVKEVKPSTREKQPTKIITEDGSELSGFHASLRSLTPGTEFEANTEVNKGYVNIVGEVKIISSGPVQPNGHDMSKEDWEKKNRIERESIEAQSARNAIFELYPILKDETLPEEVSDRIADILIKALKYTEQCLDRALKVQPAKEKTSVKSENVDIETRDIGPPFKDAGDFWAKLRKKYGKTQSEICVMLSINKPADITDFDWAWQELEKNNY